MLRSPRDRQSQRETDSLSVIEPPISTTGLIYLQRNLNLSAEKLRMSIFENLIFV